MSRRQRERLGRDRSCVLAAFYRRWFEQGSREVVVVNGNYAAAARDLGLDLPHHRTRRAMENLALSTNGRHNRLALDTSNWAKLKFTLKDGSTMATAV